MNFEFIRLVRTPSSERYMAQIFGKDLASFDLHFRTNGLVDGTVVIFEEMQFDETLIPLLLKQFDEKVLPDVSLNDKNLAFTVLRGSFIGVFQADKTS